MLKKIIEKCSTLNIYEKRSVTDKYCELVFYSKDTNKCNKIFTEIFGQATKPAGTKPTKDNMRLVKDYGGISANQTLFNKDFDNATVIAMLWPWQDGVFTTLKIALLEK